MALDLDMLRKPNSRKKGLKILVYGPTGVGKTVFGLSFPEIIAMDSEDGYAWYEGTERAKNLLGIVDSQSFDDLANLIDELDENVDDFKTLIIDSETKIYENIQEALQEVEESRAIRKGKEDAAKNLISVALDENESITHDFIGKFGGASVLLKKAPEGTGVIAGGPARAVIEMAGIKNIRTKSLGSNNKQNVVLATIEGLRQVKTPEEVAKLRGKSVEEILG